MNLAKANLIDNMRRVSGATFATIRAYTDTDARRRATINNDGQLIEITNRHKKIYSDHVVNGCLCFKYEKGIVNRLAKEGKIADHVMQALKEVDMGWREIRTMALNGDVPCRFGGSWHQPVLNNGRLTPLSKHKKKEKFYLRFMFLAKVEETIYRNQDGAVVDYEEVRPFLKDRSSYENQNLDDPLEFKTYAIESLREIKIGSETFTLE